MNAPPFPIDLVMTYVDCSNEEWQKNYSKHKTDKPSTYWRTGKNMLRYFIKSIEMNLPFINKIFIVVQNKSEVPEDLHSKLRVVTHDEFIPKNLLPTFNSITIETFIYRIPDLSEHFLYVNDDEFVLNKLDWTDFFYSEEISRTHFEYFSSNSTFREMLKRTNELVFSSFDKPVNNRAYYEMPFHMIRPYFKSMWRECIITYWPVLATSLTRFRNARRNYAMYIIDRYTVAKGKSVEDSTLTLKHIYNIPGINLRNELKNVTEDAMTLHDVVASANIMDNNEIIEFLKGRFE